MVQSVDAARQQFGAAVKMHQAGRLAEAEQLYRQILAAIPDHSDAIHFLGLSLYQQGKVSEAIPILERLVSGRPEFAEALNTLGLALQAAGQRDRAVAAYQRAARARPDYADPCYNEGLEMQSTGRHKEAIDCYIRALERKPDFVAARTNLGNVYQTMGHYEEAASCYEQALLVKPGFINALYNLGNLHRVRGNFSDALTCFDQILAREDVHILARAGRGWVLLALGKADQARQEAERLSSLHPGNREADILLAAIEEKTGDPESALSRLMPLVESDMPEPRVVLACARCKQAMGMHEDVIRLLGSMPRRGEVGLDHKKAALFSMAKSLDVLERYDEAFKAYRKGNELARVQFDGTARAEWVGMLKAFYSRKRIDGLSRLGSTSERPVFVVGMPRSGTTLVEQILDSHPQVYGAGELRKMAEIVRELPSRAGGTRYPDCVAGFDEAAISEAASEYLALLKQLAPESRYVIDKMPLNFSHVGFIHILFPRARILHCVRDPVDTCLSCFFQDFSEGHEFARDLRNIGVYYRQYRALMEHWQQVGIPMMSVQYERLVADQEKVTRDMLDYCRLDWNDNCLKFFDSDRFVATASYDQVRQPIYSRSVGRADHYRQHIEPLMEALNDE